MFLMQAPAPQGLVQSEAQATTGPESGDASGHTLSQVHLYKHTHLTYISTKPK